MIHQVGIGDEPATSTYNNLLKVAHTRFPTWYATMTTPSRDSRKPAQLEHRVAPNYMRACLQFSHMHY